MVKKYLKEMEELAGILEDWQTWKTRRSSSLKN